MLSNPLVNLIINLFLTRFSKKEVIAIKCYNTPGDSGSGSSETNLYFHEGGTPEEWLVWKNKFIKALDSQSICPMLR